MSRQLALAATSIAAAAGVYVTYCAPAEQHSAGARLAKRFSENAEKTCSYVDQVGLAEPFSADKGRPRSVLRQVDTIDTTVEK